MSGESNCNSYSSRYRQFSVSSPDILHSDSGKLPNEDHNFKPNYDLTSLNEINCREKFSSPNLSSKFGGNKFRKFREFKLPQVFNNSELISSSNNELFSKDSNWTNAVARYFKPILNYIKTPAKENDDWEIDASEIHDRQVIGRGNQGIVYCAIYRGRPVAVKTMKEKNDNEIQYLKRLKHPNVITFIGITRNEPFFFLMELCSKGELYEKLEDSDNVTRDLFIDWSKQVVKGMRYLHDNSIVHRDLKSLNLLINDANIIKICDFGNSKIFKDQEFGSSLVGTPGWMAPEVIRNEKYSEKIDIWSFGVVLWELLFCQKPYKSLQFDNHRINYGIVHRTLFLPIPSSCPAKFKNIMLACWNYEPKKRPDFHQIHVDLKAANKEFANNFSNEKFIETKRLWKHEINESFSVMAAANVSVSDDEKPMHSKKLELQVELQKAKELLKKLKQREKYLEQREKYLKRKEKELGIRHDHRSSSNGLVNSLSRKLPSNMTKEKNSSLRLGQFLRNRSRRSYRLIYAQKQLDKGSAETKDAEIQTINFDFEEGPLALLNHQFQSQCRASDSGYGGDSTTSCLSTPNVKHKSILHHNYSSAPDQNENGNLNGTSSYHVSSTYRSSSASTRQRTISGGFRLHNAPSSSAGATAHYDHVNSELPGGYLEASFENSLMLKKGSNVCAYTGALSKRGTVKESDTEISNDEKVRFSSDEDETQDISVDSLNNNKYSEIYRPSSDSSSINSSLSWENNHRHDQTLIANPLKSLNILSSFDTNRMAAINDENESDESLTINNSYVVLKSKATGSSLQASTNQNSAMDSYIVLKSPTKDHAKKNVRDSLLIYKSRGLKKDENFL